MPIPRSTLLLLLLLSPCVRATAQAPTPAAPGDHQIEWQRSLDDALRLHQQGVPLLLALNMDGESASDRIVVENYRDPAFVQATRRCVCVVASVFRHSPRDHDDQGRRIPCPRLGSVTCGEHIALEPLLFERFLADGERVAPRHALVLASGRKAWDLSLCFDLRDIDRALAESLTALGDPASRDAAAPAAAATWDALAGARDGAARRRLERAVAEASADDALDAALQALARYGDAGSLEALRLVAARLQQLPPRLQDRFLQTTRALGLDVDVAAALRQGLQDCGPRPTQPGLGETAPLLPLLAQLGEGDPTTRTLLIGCRALAAMQPHAAAALDGRIGGDGGAAIASVAAVLGGPFDAGACVQAADATTRSAPAGELPRPAPPSDAMPPADELLAALGELDGELARRPADAALRARFAKASLDYGRRRMEEGQADAALLLEDAAQAFERALAAEPQHVDWWIERARAAYFRGRFGEESEAARAAFARTAGQPTSLPHEALLATGAARATAVLDDAVAVEALRWLGDGDMRQLGSAMPDDPADAVGTAIEGLRALGAVAASPYAGADDWLALASLCGLLGLHDQELALLCAGARRLPADAALRRAIDAALWRQGRIDLAPVVAADIERSGPVTGLSAWYRGYACLLAAEDARRRQQPATAVPTYDRADAQFARAAALDPELAAGAAYWHALCSLGRGMAHAAAGRRADAADCLVAAVTTGTALAEVRDGLDCDALDLVDKVLEWRVDGPSTVDSAALLDRLDAHAGDDPFWALAVADSLLREALRADGRNPDRELQDTVDAGGQPIRMEMGRPTELGDRYLLASLAAARCAQDRLRTDDDRRVAAQSHAIWAERQLTRDLDDGVAEALRAAADLLGLQLEFDESGSSRRAAAAELRQRLGPARPRQRPGR
ncbi:MAG: hypothetical protein AB7O97_23830 [Planctomycetota bacterium]